MNEKIIEINNLVKRYKDLTAVDGLSLNVYRGDVFGFLGPNGAGKSTTIRMLLSLITPTSGDIRIFGDAITQKRDGVLRRVGAIVEKPDFYGYLSAYSNLEILGTITGADITKKKIMAMLELVGLEKRYKSKVKTFSHGMKQRLGLAQALLHDPELIILDEPTTGLDPQGMKEIRDLIVLLSKEQQKTIFLSSHILYEVELVANRMIIINKGKKVVEGEVKDLISGANLQVTIDVDNMDAARTVLSGSSFAGKVESYTQGSIVLSCRQEDVAPVNRLLVENGVNVSAVIPKRSLEEYFLMLTDKEAAA